MAWIHRIARRRRRAEIKALGLQTARGRCSDAGAHPAAQSVATVCDRIHESVNRDPGIDAEKPAHAVFALLAARNPPSEIEDAIAATPKPLHVLWPS
ncbi:hypothetical protein QM467_10895 [Rhodoblastus sp. 17X3]|uniref:hypothetical protein n=1 Tax=Rhodoblastus sp. 17X3 TaxID=3047026 RepID=UPI0024B77A8C|nr:hypothetical protein [Rhodoblastus sp. 17X3]MDI9848563.1 hypothetical protein [Rhodoblastus sp. 17X3]